MQNVTIAPEVSVIDDSTPEKIEANDQACAQEIEAVLKKWGRHMTTSCAARQMKDVFGRVTGYCMVPVVEVLKKPPAPVAVEGLTDEQIAARKAAQEATRVL